MTNNTKQTKGIIIGLIIGILLTFLFNMFFMEGSIDGDSSNQSGSKNDPLYWVAPMDPNYRRDKPGKSPMGMDLIPYYGDDGDSSESGVGTIKISPDVVNNLGVRTVQVKRQSIHTEIKTVGYVQYDEDSLVHVHPRVEGWIEKLHIKAGGDPVEEGAPLYEIYSPELVNAQEEYLLALGRKNVRLIEAAKMRLESLQLSKRHIDQLKSTRKIAQRVTFYAPQSGVVDNLNIREGNFVKPGNTIMSIGSLDEVWVEAEVFERQANLLKLNQKVTMTLDFIPGKKWIGQVDYIYPTLDAKTRTLRVRLRFENPDGVFKPNMFAQVNIHSYSMDDAVLIPTEAVIRTGNSNRVVLALGEGRFKSINVGIGRYYEEYAEITEGLTVGDEVVASAQFLLDSESSKTSDFKRMETSLDRPQSVWVEALINSVMLDHKMINVTHQPIDQWDWPEMTMDFITTSDVDLGELTEGGTAHIQIEEIKEGQYRVTGIHVPSGNDDGEIDHSGHDMNGSQMDDSEMDHSQMDHSQMDDSEMDHSQMDHSQMDHSQMDHSQMDHSQMDHSQMDDSQMNHSNHQMKGSKQEKDDKDSDGEDNGDKQ
ncbi:efflux RND transporter periplasmic adaptor subunit [Marinicella rhabdoformis]|uniref:efflux RND transporter periplasmic adaptor subunit n=1 Tax=Marinicella rhabdoformis TaxID=2580566 RepID=UPI0012AED9CD|nr:efflux RND transporter periplasmic adaptor subunit [Marinicella rhabdoformis]